MHKYVEYVKNALKSSRGEFAHEFWAVRDFRHATKRLSKKCKIWGFKPAFVSNLIAKLQIFTHLSLV